MVLFALLGKDPVQRPAGLLLGADQERLRAGRADGQGDAAAADRARPGGVLPLQRLEHRRRGPVRRSAPSRAGGVALLADKDTRPLDRARRSCVAGIARRHGCGPASSALLRDRFNANEILVSLMLVYVAELLLSYLVYGPWKDPAGYNFPQTMTFEAVDADPAAVQGLARQHRRCSIALVGGRRRCGCSCSAPRGLRAAGRRPGAGGGALCRLLVAQGAVDRAADLGRRGRPGRRARSRRAARPAHAARAGGLRLRGHHRGLRRAAASGGHGLLGDPDEHVLHRRRAGAVAPGPAEVADRRVPGPAAVHAAGLRHADRLPHRAGRCPRRHALGQHARPPVDRHGRSR